MTNDMISREAAIEMLKEKLNRNYTPSFIAGDAFASALHRIKKLPAVDAAPVVHARWVWADDGYCRCSNCTQKAPVMTQYQDEPTTTMTDYCPHCGAKMDGGET